MMMKADYLYNDFVCLLHVYVCRFKRRTKLGHWILIKLVHTEIKCGIMA